MVPDNAQEDQILQLQEDKESLIKQLNESLLKLDHLNEDKRKVHEKLLEQIKFCRDLQKAAGSGDLNSMISEDVKLCYNQEVAQHKQLELQIQKSENERLQLRNRLKQITQTNKSIERPSQKDLVDYNIQQKLMKDIDHLRAHIFQVENEINSILQQQQPNFQLLQRQITEIFNDKELIIRKTHEIMNRERDVQFQSRPRPNYKLQAQTFFNLFHKLTKIRLIDVIQNMREIKSEQEQMGEKLTKLYLRFQVIRKMYLRKFYFIWIQKIINENNHFVHINPKQLTQFYKKNTKKNLIIYKQNNEIAEYDYHETSQQFLCTTILNTTRSWEKRLKLHGFQFWSKRQNPRLLALQYLNKLRLKLIRNDKSRSWLQWKMCCKETINLVRLHALPIRIALKQLLKRVFDSLKTNTIRKQVKKRSILVRAFKNLQVQRFKQKQLKQLDILSKYISKQCKLSTAKACYDALAIQMETAITDQCKIEFALLEPSIQKLLQQKNALENLKQKNEKTRALKALVIMPFSKKLTQVILKWRNNAFKINYKTIDTKQRLIYKVYWQKLRLAFDRMKICEAYKLKQKDHEKIFNLHDNILATQNKNYSIGSVIYNENVRIRHLASKHLRSLVQSSFKRNLEYWFLRWQRNKVIKVKQIDAAQIIVNKWRKFVFTISLAKYKRGLYYKAIDIANEKKINEVKNRLAAREKRRIFNAIRKYTTLHIYKVKTLRLLLLTIDRHNQTKGLIQWKLFTRMSKEFDLLKIEQKNVNQIDSLQSIHGTAADNLQQINTETKNLKTIYTKEAQYTLAKWMDRWYKGGIQFGFKTWKEKANNLKYRSLFLFRKYDSYRKFFLKNALFRWKETKERLTHQIIVQDIKETHKQIPMEEFKNKRRVEIHVNNCNDMLESKNKIQSEHNYEKAKFDKLTERLSKINRDNFMIRKERYILIKWQKYSSAAFKCGRALERGISKLGYQRGFDEILSFGREKTKNKMRQKMSQIFFKISNVNQIRQAFNIWRETQYKHEINLIQQHNNQKADEIIYRNEFVQEVKTHHASLLNDQSYSFQLQRLWNFWHKYAFDKAIKRRQIQSQIQALDAYQQKRCLIKWSCRLVATYKQRKFIVNFVQKHKMIWQMCVFAAMKKSYLETRKMAYTTEAVMTAMKNFNLTKAFIKIKKQSEIRFRNAQNDKNQSCRHFVDLLTRLRFLRLKVVIQTLQKQVAKSARVKSIIQQYYIIGKVQNKRYCFNQWKNAKDKLNVVDFNENQDGPTNILVWNQRIKCNALAQMMQQDGQPDSVVENVLMQSRNQFFNLADRSILRLIIRPDPLLNLLPFCYDRLKNHARAIKKWKTALKFCNNFVEQSSEQLFSVFNRWKNRNFNQCKVLYSTPFSELVPRQDQTRIHVQRVANELDLHIEAIDKFKEQRDVLFKSYMSAQKLALSVSKHSFDRAQHRLIQKLSDNSNNMLQDMIGHQLNNNLLDISEFKHQIGMLEDENHEIASRNSQYLGEVMTKQRNERYLKQLQMDNQQLINQKHEHQSVINRLVEENAQLNRQLQSARVEAQNNLEYTQLLHFQKLQEIDHLKRQERESATRRANLSQQSQQQRNSSLGQSINQAPLRIVENELSPYQIGSPEIQLRKNKSPLRIQNLPIK